MPDSEFLSTRQAAVRLGVSLGTVQNMVENGVLDAWKTAGGHRRIPTGSVDTLLTKRRKQVARSGEISGALNVLITENDPALQKLYQTTIERWKLPISLRMASNGFEGLLLIGQQTPDILIADLMMPNLDGFKMICQLRAMPELSSMDIIAVSPIDVEEVRQRGIPTDVTVFAKPIPFHEIKGFLLGRLSARQRN